MQHILSRYRKCCLSKHSMIIDIEIVGKIKRELAKIINKEIKNELMKNKLHTNVNRASDTLSEDTFIKP